MTDSIYIGTCGYGYYSPPNDWKENYASKLQVFSEEYELLEVQKTFYKLPKTETCSKWRNQTGENFKFTMKAWQALTHEINSPTWRGNDEQLTEKQRRNFGGLEPNQEVLTAWNDTRERAEALDASVILIQMPPSFDPSDQAIRNVRKFFESIERGDFDIAWEPRGGWLNEEERVGEICEEYNLIHSVDLLRRKPYYVGSTCYVRLHGLNEEPYDYDYDYDKEELNELRDRLEELLSATSEIYCLFNNYDKFKNVNELKTLL